MTTLQAVELGVLGPLQVRQGGAPVAVPGAKSRAILTMLGLHGGSVVAADTLVELLWGEDPPRTAAKALQTHISSLRRALGDGFVLTQGTGWAIAESEVDASRYTSAARLARDAAATGDISQAVARFEDALALWRGIPELPDGRRGTSEKTRWIEGHAALVEDRADALLATSRAAEIIGELEAAVADAPLRERRWGQLMLALYRAGRQGDALGAYQRARTTLAEELGIDPGPELRRLEAAIVAQDASLDVVVAQQHPSVMRAVTFLLTDIEGSTAAWEADSDAMAVALARHDELAEQVVTSRGGRLIKTRGEGDATFSVFERPSAAAAAAMELQDAITREEWGLREPMRIRIALHTGEVELRDGDYFGRAVNRAARLRSLAVGGQILCSGATAELVIDSLPDDVVLADLGLRELRNLARPEHVFELRLETAEEGAQPPKSEAPMERPGLPAVLIGTGPFVGRGTELERLLAAWQTSLGGGACAALIAGEPGVGKTRLAGEWSRQAYEQGAVVLYGRCDEDLGAPYQPFAEALRSMVPCVGTRRLRGLRGVEALLPLVPGLVDEVPDLAAPTRADPETERYALFDAVVAVLEMVSTEAPVVLVLDDLHWAAKPTLLLLRHLLRFGDSARVQIVGTYRGTDLDRSHPLAAMLADLHRDGTANRINLSGLDEDDVSAYVAKVGYDDEELGPALASVTGGNPFFLIEALRHVDESGGVWDPSTLPQGVREAVSRRLSRLPVETNKALAAAAVVGSRFALDLVERVVGDDLVDAFDEASKAGIVIEEPGGRYRFNHALVRQSLLAELPSMRRMRLHQRIATTLEDEPGADDELLAELAHHYFECAWAGNAAKAVEYCRRAADQAMTRLAYEGAADLYDHALHALEEIDDELSDRDDQVADLLVARCEALLAAGDVASAAGAVSQLQQATVDSARLSAWATCFDGQLSISVHPERLDDVEAALDAAAHKLAEIDDAAGEAKAHTVRATCLARLGRIGECEVALDDALTAARRAREHRRVNAVLAGAPLAALWGPNPVPRAGGRCLDVVRLLRITTDSPAVEATSTRCQAVLEAFRGRDAAARRMIDSARRTVTELGLRHALLEVEQFAGIVELVLGDPAAAEPHLRQACNGFRRMGLDADTAETAALLGRACLALDRDAEADELCTESERLAGHALKASIAWRTLRAQLLSRHGDHDEARRVAEAAVALAERTDGLVDHGDACLALATVLGAAGDTAGARAAAERAANLYERKGAAALADRARSMLDERFEANTPTPPEAPVVQLGNACVRAIRRLEAALDREAWDEIEQQVAPIVSVESRRKVVGHTAVDLSAPEWTREGRHHREMFASLHTVVVAVRGERLGLARVEVGTADATPGAPRDEMLQIFGIDTEGRIALCVLFDIDDMDAAIAELDALHDRFEDGRPQARRLENAACQVADRFLAHFAAGDWDAMAEILADNLSNEDRRRVVSTGVFDGRDAQMANTRAIAELWSANVTRTVMATRGRNLSLASVTFSRRDEGVEGFLVEMYAIVEIDADERITSLVIFDLDDFDAALAELDDRYLTGEAAAHASTWSAIVGAYGAINRHELPTTTLDFEDEDHRRGAAFAAGDMIEYLRAGWDLDHDISFYIEAAHRLNDVGAVVTHKGCGTSRDGFDAEWREVMLFTTNGDSFSRCEVFDEADVDAAIARFEQLSRPAPRLENTASRANARLIAYVHARDWDAAASSLADHHYSDDRRRVTGAGTRRGRDADIENFRVVTDLGANITVEVIATRGDRLVLTRNHVDIGDKQHPFMAEFFAVVETNLDGLIVAVVELDLEDFDAAIAELDVRYLAGEAAAHSEAWLVIAEVYAALNRGEMPAAATDLVDIDHRRFAAIGAGDLMAYLQAAAAEDAPRSVIYIETVHRLTDLGAVTTHVVKATSREGFDAEWRITSFFSVGGDRVNRYEYFDEADLSAALARFDELQPQTPRPQNTASQAYDRFRTYFAARDWAAMAELLTADSSVDDHRRVVNAENRRGRDAEIANMRAFADIGTTRSMATIIATRGERLVLCRTCISGEDPQPGGFRIEMLIIVETTADEQILARVAYDPDDFEAAIAELDARYLAGEAAAHTRTWSVITGVFVAHNRREIAATTPDAVSIDHRRGAAFAPGKGFEYIRAGWDLGQDLNIYIEMAHRLNDLGAVLTWAGHGTSREGFDAEWRGVTLMTVDGDMVSRMEVFDEADLDSAIARFDQLTRPAPPLENTASRVDTRFQACFAARDWDAMAEMLSDGFSIEDRRRVVNMGNLQGRDAELGVHSYAVVGSENVTSTVIATRAQRLALSHYRFSGRDQRPDAFRIEMLALVEIDADDRMAAVVVFDVDDFDAAIAELDARYLAGEAAAHAHTWTLIAQVQAAYNRHEVPPTTADWVNIDHRRGRAFAPNDMIPYLRATYDVAPNVKGHLEAVHRLSNLGVVVTENVTGTSQDGFAFEWREVALFVFEGELVSRFEIFDEADLDTALARFDELQPPRLENTTTRIGERIRAHFAARDWNAMAEFFADDICTDDRRRIVGAGIRHGRDAEIASMKATAEVGTKNMTGTVVATRGESLALGRVCFLGDDQSSATFLAEVLGVVETNADNMIKAVVVFDPDDIAAALEELDTRYIAGEAAAHARTWSVITGAYASVSHHELPALTPDCVTIDNRRVTAFAPGQMTAYIRAGWEIDQTIRTYVEVVHRLTDLGAVCTYAAHGVSHEGFDGEWRGVNLATVDGDMVNRSELFDEEDLDAALARFDELQPQAAGLLKNAASATHARLTACIAARDRNALSEILADDIAIDDRRRVVNSGITYGRDAAIANMGGVIDLGLTNVPSTVTAIRGDRLDLCRTCITGQDRPDAFQIEFLSVVEIDADERIVARVLFDPEDIDAAFDELDARYLAGEAAAHAHVWSVTTNAYAALNRHELPPVKADWVNIDHRRVTTFAPGDLTAYIRAAWDHERDHRNRIEIVHRVNHFGAVVTRVSSGTSQQGFEAEWRSVDLLTVEGDLINRFEIFDEADLDAALARFDELHPQAPRLQNAASQVDQRFLAYFAARDWDAIAEILSDNMSEDDRRRVVNSGIRQGRGAQIASARAIADVGVTHVTSTVIAIRGERLALGRYLIGDGWGGSMVLYVCEIDAENRIVARVVFDLDDIDAAFAELDARYLAGEAAAYARTWLATTEGYAALNRHDIPRIASDIASIDHRRGLAFAPGEIIPYTRGAFDVASDIKIHIEVVHRLNNFGAVFTHAADATSHEGFNGEWREIALLTVDGDVVSRCEMFDETDLDAALARFDELDRPARLQNAASRTWARSIDAFNRRDVGGYLALMTTDGRLEDRRKGLRGLFEGSSRQKAVHALLEEAPESWRMTTETIAVRGSRLALTREYVRDADAPGEPIAVEVLTVMEGQDGLVHYAVGFDPDDIDAAFAELDARYVMGEAAAHSHTWSVIARSYSASNRHELPGMTPDSLFVDHRPGVTTEGEDLAAYLPAVWDLVPDISVHIEKVHRLSELGGVITHAARGTTQEGFKAEWRTINVGIVEGDLLSRVEVFDETDLDVALARFDELQTHTRRLENAAAQADSRFFANIRARDWAAAAEMLTDNSLVDDRRRVVNIGVWQGRDVVIANLRALAEALADVTSTVIALRGERLALTRISAPDSNGQQGDFGVEMLGVAELDDDNQVAAHVLFDPDDMNAAFEELDARYLAGEAAAYAGTWSVVAGIQAAVNRRELPPMTPNPGYIDHRPLVSVAGADLAASIRAILEIHSAYTVYIEAVHQLDELGAVYTQAHKGTSRDGFDAEWRIIEVQTVKGDLLSHVEVFDEADLDAALARFEELHPQAQRLENAATQVVERFQACFVARDWNAMTEILAEDVSTVDHRPVMRAGTRQGRDINIGDWRSVADVGFTNMTSTFVATRGERLVLGRYLFSTDDERPDAFHNDVLGLTEINADNRIAASAMFELDDLDTVIAELDARYLAGEAATHAHTWSVIMQAYAALNRREIFATTAGFVDIDHRSLTPIGSGDLKAFMSEALNDGAYSVYVETVHRLSDLGAVVTVVSNGTSQDGFDGEWRTASIFTVEGDLISRVEIFDEADLDAALARFEELNPQVPRPENAASQVAERFRAFFAARGWDALAELLADDYSHDDRRRVVGAGVRDGRDAQIADLRAIADLWGTGVKMTVIATRGERLVLRRLSFAGREQGSDAFLSDILNVAEINAGRQYLANVSFDLDDVDAAFEELDARYMAGEAAPYARTWSVMARTCAVFNQGELPATTPDSVFVDHRPVLTVDAVDLPSYLRAMWDVTPDIRVEIEAVHRLSDLGAVVTHVVNSTSPEGFNAEWRGILICTLEAEMVNRHEVFDEADLDAALARFDELEAEASG